MKAYNYHNRNISSKNIYQLHFHDFFALMKVMVGENYFK